MCITKDVMLILNILILVIDDKMDHDYYSTKDSIFFRILIFIGLLAALKSIETQSSHLMIPHRERKFKD